MRSITNLFFILCIDPYVFQSWTLLTMKQPGIIQRANIYSVDKDKIELEFENDGMLFRPCGSRTADRKEGERDTCYHSTQSPYVAIYLLHYLQCVI